MKNYQPYLFSILLLFSFLTTSAQNGKYDVRLISSTDCDAGIVYLDVEVKAHSSTTTFNIADQNYRFTFNDVALGPPTIDEEYNLSGVVFQNGVVTSVYDPHDLTGSMGDLVSLNLVLAGGYGYLLSETDWLPVTRLAFPILAPTAKLWFKWNEENDPLVWPSTFIGEKFASNLYQVDAGTYINASIPGCSCTQLDSEGFEAGWGIWNKGGVDAARSIQNAIGNYSIRLRDNSGQASSMFTDPLALGFYNEVTIDFSYYAVSMEFKEDFYLDVSYNNGQTWASVENWVSGDDFVNNQRYYESVTVHGIMKKGFFTNSVRFRLRCDASGNGDLVYIDEVSITACKTLPVIGFPTFPPIIVNPVTQDQATQEALRLNQTQESSAIQIQLYPNPTSDQLTIELEAFESKEAQLMVIGLAGKVVHQEILQVTSGVQKIQFDASRLLPGSYFIHLVDGKTRATKKFVVAH